MDAKTVAFTLMMGALGNLLFAVSYHVGQLAPGVALDFSLLAAFIAGFYGGPMIGLFSGLLVGILPGIMFGPMGMGSWLGLVGLPLGKGLTGLTAGILARALSLGRNRYSSLLAVPTTLLAYVPECLYTYAYFAFLMPFFLGSGGAAVFIYYILPKALAEVVIMSFFMAALMGNSGFNNFLSRFFLTPSVHAGIKASEAK
jgi:riboflavin transporter FmnP